MSLQTIQSNAIRGEYLHQVMDKTMNEIHDDLVTVFGPYATDAFLTVNDQPYYTRDGKETIRNLKFDNELSMYLLKIMYQAVYQQGAKVGDGTTTLAVLYTNLYKEIRKAIDGGIVLTRKGWNNMISKLNERLKNKAVKMDSTKMMQMLYTCTQDEQIAATLYHKLGKPLQERAYITVDKSNIESDFEMEVHENPLIPATKQFSVFPVKSVEEDATILHCNGMLDIVHMETLASVMTRVASSIDNKGEQNFYPQTVIILCNGLTEATRKSVKELVTYVNQIKEQYGEQFLSTLNNVAIYTLNNYRGYSSEVIEDISTIITDENGISGLVNALTFESMLYQTFETPNKEIPELRTFDADTRCLGKMRDMLSDRYKVEFDDIKGIRIYKPYGPFAQKRYEDLVKQIEDEKSEIKKIDLMKRLRTTYGKFIEVKVGSALMKDSQRKFELILDAILSASEGVEKGVLEGNSILIAIQTLEEMEELYHHGELQTDDEAEECAAKDRLEHALLATMIDMMKNAPHVGEVHEDDILGNIEKHDIRKFDMTNVDGFFPDADVEKKSVKLDADDTVIEFEPYIIEPVSIITTMLKNSTTMLELATAKTIHLNTFQQNYI